MPRIIRVALRRRYTVVVLALLLVGPLAALRLPTDILPEARIRRRGGQRRPAAGRDRSARRTAALLQARADLACAQANAAFAETAARRRQSMPEADGFAAVDDRLGDGAPNSAARPIR